MKIGLDYGGVISFSPDGWKQSIRKAIEKGHEFYLISHIQPDNFEGARVRQEFTKELGIINLTFSNLNWYSQHDLCCQRKTELCQQYGIEIFIDDDLDICHAVSKNCDRCATFHIPVNLWQIGQRIIDNLDEDKDW